jgi:magnesium and cobalt exporter, CNNM family
MTIEYILLLIALILSAFFSGSETAYTVAGRLAMEVYSRHKRPGAKTANRLYSDPGFLFSTTLVGNNLVGVLYSSLAAIILTNLGISLQGIFIISPLLILLFGEIIPKTIARERSEKFAMFVSRPLLFSYYLLFPLIIVSKFSSGVLLRIFGSKSLDSPRGKITISELQGVWFDLHKSGEIDDAGAELLDQMVLMREKKLREIMTSRSNIVSISIDANVDEALNLMFISGFSRIPVYQNSVDNIRGVILLKDFFDMPEKLTDIIRPVIFVPEQASISRVLEPFRRREVGIAVVVDEYGGSAGIITFEDVIEELIGEVVDEHDQQSIPGKVVAQNAYLVSGRTELVALKEHWNIDLPEGDYDTIAGLIIQKLGAIPSRGETLRFGNWNIRIADSDERHIKKVLIRK